MTDRYSKDDAATPATQEPRQPGEASCLQCGKLFIKRRPWHAFCDVPCRQQWYKEMVRRGRAAMNV